MSVGKFISLAVLTILCGLVVYWLAVTPAIVAIKTCGFIVLVIALFLVFGALCIGIRDTSTKPYVFAERFLIEGNIENRTLGGFRVQHFVTLLCETTDNEELIRQRMNEASGQQAFLASFNAAVFEKYLEERSYVSRIVYRDGQAFGVFYECVVKDGEETMHEVATSRLEEEQAQVAPFNMNGCSARLQKISRTALTEELLRGNYAMLTEKQKEQIRASNWYQDMEEKVVIGVLKRHAELQELNYRQSHDSTWVVIETEQKGRGVRITWRMKGSPGKYELVGYRKCGGFSPNQYDEQSNGTLVIQTNKSNSTTEFLKPGETYFYTFMWRSYKQSPRTFYAVCRFQLTVITEEEEKVIANTIRRIEEKSRVDPDKRHISQALKELGMFVEFDTAMEATKRSLTEQIRKSDYSEEERAEKIARLDDFVASLRTKYEP